MASTPDNINKVRNCSDVCHQRKKHFSGDIWTGVIPSFCPLVMTLFAVRNVIPPWWFWKYTTKKLHYLNVTERSWDMDKSISDILLFTVKQCRPTKNKKLHEQRHGEVHSSLFCHAIFYFESIIHYFWRFENFPIKQKRDAVVMICS